MEKTLHTRKLPGLTRLVGAFLLLWCFSSVQEAHAQHRVSGVVVDQKGVPVIGATILEQGLAANGVSSGPDGQFSISVAGNGFLEVSFLGYKSQAIAVGNRTSIQIVLEEDSRLIDDVVVVGYGTQKKVNLTGAVGSVNVGEQLSSRSLPNISAALAGMVPGLAVNQNTGMAGTNQAQLIIRGLGSTNRATPLIVVDGLPDGDMNRINLNDIESISVLKDASSAAVYGSRAANGVVLITTKSGSNDKTQINFSSSYAVSKPIKMIDLMPDYPRNIQAMIRAAETGNTSSPFRWGAVEQWAALSYIDPFRYPNTDWMDLTSRNGQLQNYSLSASGGNDRSKFYISAGIMDEKGILMGNDFTRYDARFNYSYKIRHNITVGARFSGSWSKWDYSQQNGWFINANSGGMIAAIPGVTPYDPVTGKYGGAMMYGESTMIYNPLRTFETEKIKQDRQNMQASVNVEWSPIEGLAVGVDYNLFYNNQLTKNWNVPVDEWNFQTDSFIRNVITRNQSRMNDTNGTDYRTLLNSRVNYGRSFGKHDVNALFVYSEEYAFSRNLSGQRSTALHPSLTELNGFLQDVMSAGGNSAQWGLRSYISRVNYTFDDRYLLELNFRVDGSSKFRPGHQYGFFPSAAVGWRFTEESFISSLKKIVSNGKLRLSYGGLGNNHGVGNFEQLETLAAAHYSTGGDIAMGLINRKLINHALTWETTYIFNAGLDLGFLNNRLFAELDYYHRYTKDMLRPDDLSTLLSGAYDAPKKNIGEMLNQGFEINLTWNHQVRDFRYSVNLNGSYNWNQLKEWNSYLSRGNVFLDMPYGFVYTQVNRGGITQTWQEIYDSPFHNVGQAPGDMLLEDLNGDGYIDGDDRKAYPNFHGSRPTANIGMNMTASWKGFDFAMYWVATGGRRDYWVNHFNNVGLLAGAQSMTYTQYSDSWDYDNRGAMLPRLVIGTRGVNRANSTYWLDNMAYIRLKNLQLGYTIPDKALRKIGVSKVRVLISGENLWTITNYRGLDPEKALTGSGDSNDAYPISRTLSFGINITI